MSQYCNAQTPTKLETAASAGGAGPESAKPITFNGSSQESNGNAKLSAVTAGHSSKIGG